MHAKEMLNKEQKQFYRDQLRLARDAALADAEGFMAVIHTLELMGQQLTGKMLTFGGYQTKLNCVAGLSLLSRKIVSKQPTYHTKFDVLYEELRQARNGAVHQGAYARILTDHAVDISIILEDALMSGFSKVSQFMVRDVVEAKSWHPISYVRQQMLKHGFSYIPVWFKDEKNGKWKLISEYLVARYLRDCSNEERDRRLVTKIEDAVKTEDLYVLKAETVCEEAPISEILKRLNERPLLVVNHERENALAGILTAADVL